MSGITDNAAIGGHDVIARAEDEERRLHGDAAIGGTMTPKKEGEAGAAAVSGTSTGTSGTGTGGTEKKPSVVDKVKDALNMK